jgi:uncharacterized protein (DUF302 family)
MSHLGIETTVNAPFETVLERVPDALKAEGFGILTRIDMKETLKAKLGVDFRRYQILGACNPPFAHRALGADLDVGLMLPCNVIVYELGPDTTKVVAVDPERAMSGHDAPDLHALASEVRAKLARVIDAL